MDRETKDRIADFYTAAELVEFLQIPVEEIIERFEDEIEALLPDIDLDMDYRD